MPKILNNPLRLAGGLALAAMTAMPFSLSAQSFLGGLDGRAGRTSSTLPTYHLMQLSVDADEVSLEEFESRTSAIQSCTDGVRVAREIGADVRRDRFVRASDMPSNFHDLVKDVPSGQSTPVFTGGGSDALRVFVVCNRG